MSLPGWEGGGWVTLHINPTFIYGQLDQLFVKSPYNDFLKTKYLCLGSISTHLKASGGFLIKTKMKAYTKLTVECAVRLMIRSTQRHLAAVSASGLPLPQACGLSISQLEKWSPSLSCNLFMYFSITK